MTAKLYFNTSNHSFRQMKAHLNNNNIEHNTQCIKDEPLTWEQLLDILMHTENGIDDLLSLKSKEYLKLIEQGVVFDKLSLTQFHNMVIEHPTIVRSPILVTKSTTLIGYNEEATSLLKSRKEKRTAYNQILSILQMNDRISSEAIAY